MLTDMVKELPIFIWPAQSCLKYNSCNLFISASNEDVLCCPPRSIQESLPSCGSRGVKIISHTQDKGEYKRLQEVQGTMLEVQQQRGAVTPHTAPWSHCPEGKPKFINLRSSDWWTAAYKQVYSQSDNVVSTKPRAPSLIAVCSSSSLQTPQGSGYIAGVVVISSYLACFFFCHCAGLLYVFHTAV